VKIEAQHVPYKGTGPMLTDLLSGQTQLTYNGILPLVPHAKSGKLRVIAVGSLKRLPMMPDVPTVAEQGFPGFETSQWYGVLAPAGTPRAIIDKLNADINKVLADPDIVRSGWPMTARWPAPARPSRFRHLHRRRGKALGPLSSRRPASSRIEPPASTAPVTPIRRFLTRISLLEKTENRR
jgi:hypothetical protein